MLMFEGPSGWKEDGWFFVFMILFFGGIIAFWIFCAIPKMKQEQVYYAQMCDTYCDVPLVSVPSKCRFYIEENNCLSTRCYEEENYNR